MLLYPLAYPLDFFGWLLENILTIHPLRLKGSLRLFFHRKPPTSLVATGVSNRSCAPGNFSVAMNTGSPIFSAILNLCGGIQPWNSSCKLQLKLQKSKLFFTTCCLMIWSGLYYDYHYPPTGNPVLIQPRFQKKLFPLSEPVPTPPAPFPPAESQVLGLVSWFSWLGNLCPNGGLTIWEQC